jgi:hypothetical protein
VFDSGETLEVGPEDYLLELFESVPTTVVPERGVRPPYRLVTAASRPERSVEFTERRTARNVDLETLVDGRGILHSIDLFYQVRIDPPTGAGSQTD